MDDVKAKLPRPGGHRSCSDSRNGPKRQEQTSNKGCGRLVARRADRRARDERRAGDEQQRHRA
ncbi:MAG: hypothetical protein ACXWUN_08910, partial [Allosphingosinicella sp.]